MRKSGAFETLKNKKKEFAEKSKNFEEFIDVYREALVDES